MGPKQGLLDGFGLELELLDPEVLLGLINQGHHSLGAVFGHDQQLLVMVQDRISHPKGGGPGPSSLSYLRVDLDSARLPPIPGIRRRGLNLCRLQPEPWQPRRPATS